MYCVPVRYSRICHITVLAWYRCTVCTVYLSGTAVSTILLYLPGIAVQYAQYLSGTAVSAILLYLPGRAVQYCTVPVRYSRIHHVLHLQ
jgi:uncharacterized membrane protein